MTERTPQKHLHKTAERLSERDHSLLRLVRSSRFATTKQLARFHAPRYASRASALRQTSRALKFLLEHALVSTLERRIGGRRTGSTGFVWALTPKGHRLLDALDGRQPRRRYRPELEPSTAFLEHTLAVTEAHVLLEETAIAGKLDPIAFESEPTCWRRYLGPNGVVTTLKPDAFVVTAVGDYEDRSFLEIDRATEALSVIVRKCLAYQEYRRSQQEQRQHGLFPAVIWVTPTQQRADQLARRMRDEPGLAAGLFSVVALDGFVGRILAGPAPPEA